MYVLNFKGIYIELTDSWWRIGTITLALAHTKYTKATK